jgi:hypothetical protein
MMPLLPNHTDTWRTPVHYITTFRNSIIACIVHIVNRQVNSIYDNVRLPWPTFADETYEEKAEIISCERFLAGSARFAVVQRFWTWLSCIVFPLYLH